MDNIFAKLDCTFKNGSQMSVELVDEILRNITLICKKDENGINPRSTYIRSLIIQDMEEKSVELIVKYQKEEIELTKNKHIKFMNRRM